jgi:hypothetical protein
MRADQMGIETGDARQVRLLRGPAPAALTQTLGVLHHPQSGVEELPESAFTDLGFSEVWIDAVRRVAMSSARRMWVFLIPGISGDGACSPGVPRRQANPGEPLVGMDIYNPGGQVGARAYSVDDVVAGRAVLIFPLFAARGHELVFGLVPDNVSRVEVKADDMPAQIAQVMDNFFEVEAQIPMNQGPRKTVTSVTTAITWYDASGKSLKTVSRNDRRAFLLRAKVDLPGT